MSADPSFNFDEFFGPSAGADDARLIPKRGRNFDPITAAEGSLCHGRIGLVAWALFEQGDGLVLSFDKMGKPFTVEAHSKPEKDGFLVMAGDLMAQAEKLR
jgi:hypothetical protein